LKWIRSTKKHLLRKTNVLFDESKVRNGIYRPFTRMSYYFERVFNEDVYQFPRIYPVERNEGENVIICVVIEAQIPFSAQMTKYIACHHYGGRQTQCFPFYVYDEDGGNRRENITDWSLAQFRAHYNDNNLSKWDIFHYVYAVLHHPQYRTTYEDNLKRELPRIPFAPDFWSFVHRGDQLAQLHVHYEAQEPYSLDMRENSRLPLDWRVERMRLSRDKTQIFYNDFLTIAGIPSATFSYQVGHRSALEWIIDQYQVTTDKRSGIVNDPNRSDDPQYIVRLIAQVVTVSLKTIQLITQLPTLDIAK